MASNKQRRYPVPISTIDIDVDEIDTTPREEYRQQYIYDEATSLDLYKKRTRSCLIILVIVLIIITLLSVAGVIIAIYSLVLSTGKAETITTTVATSTATVIATNSGLLCSSSPSTSYQYSTTTPVQCFNYTNDTDPTRNIGYTDSINFCDNVSPFYNTTSTWIRFTGPAGIVVANTPIPPNHCGAIATGWYAGQYPMSIYSTATSIVCFCYTTATCASCTLISVTNCKTFYVFLLPTPPSCNYRYCTL